MRVDVDVSFRRCPDDDTALILAQILSIITSLDERTKEMATSFDDIKREVGEQGAVTDQVLAAVSDAIALIVSLRDQLAQGGLTAEEAAALAADLDAQQSKLAAKLAELSAAINPQP